MRIFSGMIKIWLPMAVISAGLCGLVYLSVQQSLRMGANDPQIQMAEDAANQLNAGTQVESVIPAGKVEISTSLAPFLIIFDESGKVIASSAVLHGQIPDYPAGVLDYTKQNGEDRVTWQPEAGVRMATVVMPTLNGFVMAGRSLREVEIRETTVQNICGLALVAIWVGSFIVVAIGEFAFPRTSH